MITQNRKSSRFSDNLLCLAGVDGLRQKTIFESEAEEASIVGAQFLAKAEFSILAPGITAGLAPLDPL